MAIAADSGAERWRFSTDGSIVSSPAVVDGIGYVGSRDGTVYARPGEESTPTPTPTPTPTSTATPEPTPTGTPYETGTAGTRGDDDGTTDGDDGGGLGTLLALGFRIVDVSGLALMGLTALLGGGRWRRWPLSVPFVSATNTSDTVAGVMISPR